MIKKVVLTQEQQEIIRVPVNIPKFSLPRGTVHILEARCKECGYCWTYCPKDVLVKSDRLNANGYHPASVEEGMEDSCVACKMCETICPEFAIFIEEVE